MNELLKDISAFRVGLEDEFGDDIFDDEGNLLDPVTGQVIRTEQEFRSRMRELEEIASDVVQYVEVEDVEPPRKQRVANGHVPVHLICSGCGTAYYGIWIHPDRIGTEKWWECKKCGNGEPALFRSEVKRYEVSRVC